MWQAPPAPIGRWVKYWTNPISPLAPSSTPKQHPGRSGAAEAVRGPGRWRRRGRVVRPISTMTASACRCAHARGITGRCDCNPSVHQVASVRAASRHDGAEHPARCRPSSPSPRPASATRTAPPGARLGRGHGTCHRPERRPRCWPSTGVGCAETTHGLRSVRTETPPNDGLRRDDQERGHAPGRRSGAVTRRRATWPAATRTRTKREGAVAETRSDPMIGVLPRRDQRVAVVHFGQVGQPSPELVKPDSPRR
jgi:hypothetical protein